jgi:transcriptional regulator with XRE-family HTH domain
MKTLSAIVSGLQAIKGDGLWEELARECRVSYTAISRIARGKMKSPGILACERISAALDQKRFKPRAERRTPEHAEG